MAHVRFCVMFDIERLLTTSALIDRESSTIGCALVLLILKGLVRFEVRRVCSSQQKGHLRRDDEIESDAQSESVCESQAIPAFRSVELHAGQLQTEHRAPL